MGDIPVFLASPIICIFAIAFLYNGYDQARLGSRVSDNFSKINKILSYVALIFCIAPIMIPTYFIAKMFGGLVLLYTLLVDGFLIYIIVKKMKQQESQSAPEQEVNKKLSITFVLKLFLAFMVFLFLLSRG